MPLRSDAFTARVRPAFPALRRSFGGHPIAYFDGPGGTQVPQRVVDAIADYLLNHNANDGWAYATSVETDQGLQRARATVAAFLNATPNEVVFGANMTTLTFHLARAIGRSLVPGDEIVVTDLDHHANVDPWVALARDYGATIRRVPLRDGRPELDLDAYRTILSSRTKLVAVGLSSNAFGTINPVAAMVADAHRVGALAFVDAVHAAAHGALDVRMLDADLLAFSAYKVYGPHVGVAYVRDALLDRLEVPKLAPQADDGAKRAESGTINFEGIAGTAAALDYIADLDDDAHASFRDRVVRAMRVLASEEQDVFRTLVAGLRAIDGVTTYEPQTGVPRHPTIAFSVRGLGADDVSRALGDAHGVFVSHGNFYAATAVAQVAPAVADTGGVIRAGIAMYTTPDDVQRLLNGVASLVEPTSVRL